MQAYCSRCEAALSELPEEQLQLGVCPSCGGQITMGEHSGQLGIDGAVGMTFSVGSGLATPLSEPFDQRAFGTFSEGDTGIRKSPDLKAFPEDSDTTPAALPGGTPPHLAFSFDAPPAEAPPAPPAEFGMPAEPPASALPAHLQLPQIDFSMPSFSPGSSTDSTPMPVSTGGAELPAHLQLPSFPQFELPPIPGMEPAAAPATDSPGEGDAPAAAPPPPPPPPRRRKTQEVAVPSPDALPDLPNIGLPAMAAPQQTKKEVTLLSSEAAAELAHVPTRKRSMTPYFLLLLLVGTSGGVFYKRDMVIALVTKDAVPAAPSETNDDRARTYYAAGKKAYEANKLGDAIMNFDSALALSPTFSKAHRGLGIAYAKKKQVEQAVAHYRRYVELEPNAPDAVEVRKIVEDYDKAQKAKAETAASAEAEKSKKKKKR